MRRWWAVVIALILLLLLWKLQGGGEGPADSGRPAGLAVQAVPPVAEKAPAAVPPPAPVEPEKPPPGQPAKGEPATDAPVGVFGRVVRADRSPAADLPVTVSLDGKVLAEVRTDADGAYRLPSMDIPAAGRTHFVFTFVVRDGKGDAARDTLRMGVSFDPDEERTVRVGGCGMQTLVLRGVGALPVRVTAGGASVEGATVWAEEETPFHVSTEPSTTGRDGLARIADLPPGRWTVFARSPGHGAGRTSAEAPAPSPIEVALSPRVLEIEAVDASSGAPVEGIRFHVFERRPSGETVEWLSTIPPIDPPPTDSAGKTRLESIGEVELAFLPIPRGREEPVEGWKRVEADARATTVRIPVPALRTLTFPVEAGERGVPPEGTTCDLGEERHLVHPVWGAKGDPRWTGTIRGGALVVSGVDPGPFRALARAPDGSLARLEAPADAARGAPTRFRVPRRLTVVVKDEDGRPVGDPVALLGPDGVAVAQPEFPAAEGRTVFEGLFAGEVVVCALARTEWGGAEVARVDLAAGDRTIEAVVGRVFTVVARLRVRGMARLPEEYELRWLTPGPPVRGRPHEEMVDEAKEFAGTGHIRLHVRPWAPGKPVTLQVTVPGRKPVTREIQPPAAGAEASVDIDIE